MKHSLYGPSTLERRSLCPGSARMERDMPDVETDDSKHGTEMHRKLVEALQTMDVDDDLISEIVADIKPRIPANAIVLFEETLDCSFIRPGEVGTLDFAAVVPFGEAYIEDWKFGWSHVTPAKENLQLCAYAVAIWQKFECSSVTVALRQPLRNHYSTCTYSAERLKGCAVLVPKHIVEDCEKPDAPLIASPKACQFCKAAGRCPERLQMIQTPASLVSLNQVAEFVAKCHDANFREVLGKAEHMIYSALMAGGTVPGFRLVQGREKNREWTEDADAVVKELVGEQAYTRSLISPAAVERIAGKSKSVREKLDRVTRRDPGEMKLERVRGAQA